MPSNRIVQIFAFVTVCIFSFSCKVKVKELVEYPEYTDYTTPSPAPIAPGETFSPEMSGEAKKETPLCAEWTRTAGPDESIVISGVNFTGYKRGDKVKDSRFTVYSSKGLVKDASIQRLDRDMTIITIDKNMPEWSMYLIWPSNKNGYGKPIAINKTDAWWLGPEKVRKGSVVSLYGRNLSQHNDSISSNIYIKHASGAGVWAKVVKVNPYKVDFQVPSDLPKGEYEVWAHNGHGGKYGWSGPLKLTIRDEEQWSKAIYNVKNYGAKGDGLADDTQAITAALEAARKSARSTIYFPEGTYMITKMLTISDNTRWRGDGSDKTSIICGPKFFTNQTMIFGRVKNVEIDQICFNSNSNYKGRGPEHRTEVINLDWSSNIKLKNIKFSFKGYSALRLDNSNEVVIVNCKFIGKKSFLGSCSNLIIDKCDFYLTNDTENALHTWGGKNISMTNSSCRDLDNTNLNDGSGWGKGRFFHAAGNSGSTRHTYLENNRTYDLAVRPVGTDQNSGEQFLWEGFAARWSGQVLSSSHSETTLKGFSKSLTPLKSMAVITKGRGLGQSRWVASASGATIRLESPWNVEPDKTSTIAIGHFADKIVMYKNYIDGKAWQVDSENITASSGIQPYGGVHNFIADRNMLTEVRTGIANWATQHAVGIDPNYFNLYTNNTIIHSRWAILNALLEVERPGIGLMGTTYRGNIINNAIESGIAIWLSAVETPIMESFLYEHNRFSNVPKGFFLRKTAPKSIETQTFYKNSFKASSANIAIEVTPDQKTRGNIYTGFSSLYSNTSVKNSFESPFHVIEITGKSDGTISNAPFTLWNTSVGRLNVKLKTDTKWLNVSEKNVTISSESSSTVMLKANPSQLSQGIHRTYLTVTSGDQSKKYTVIFKVTL